jgi:XTP/dITP diphosphohydrolase
MAPQLLIASNNRGKVDEFRELLQGSGWEIVSSRELGLEIEVDETGRTYRDNALIKAETFGAEAGMAALSDDSGLEVDALDGEPGALHHQNGWDGRDNADRIQILLNALKDVPPDRRSSRYRAVIVVVLPDGRVLEEEGTSEGFIVDQPAGSNGFGYDPVFYLPELGKTMAQLSLEEKNRISHRGLAAARMLERLKELASQFS